MRPLLLSQVKLSLQDLPPIRAKRVDKTQGQLAGRASRWA
jgi:hypothetical protein